ncbi:MAG: beta-CASP ribonuclease aCPSF1 [Candidatus Aenigmatarchaeota archaeon]
MPELEILQKVKDALPRDAISRVELEGSEIIVYTKSREFFQRHEAPVKEVVAAIKKRIEVRPEGNLTNDQEATKKRIMEIVPPEAAVKDIYFEPERSLVIIVAEKPGLVIGRGGDTFRQIRSETMWVPRIERIPPIKSEIIEGIRKVLHKEVKFRKKFLNDIGKSIFSERITNRDWIRVIALGGFREVGRSCMLVETPKSKVLVDCGLNLGGTNGGRYPILQTREFDPNDLDAVIVSHAHLDHCGVVPYLYEYGYKGPLYCTTPTVDLFAMLCLDYIDVMQRNGVNPMYTAKAVKEAVKHSVPLEYGEVSDVAPDVRLTLQNAGHILGSALVHLHIGEGMHNIVWACDMKYARTTLFEPAFTDFQRLETLVIESTYGGEECIMPHRQEAETQLMAVINRAMERGGTVIVPTFSVERSQDVMAILVNNDFQYPVFIDGMIWDATGIFTAYPEYMSNAIQRKIFNNEDPFLSKIFRRIASQAEREKSWTEKPAVILSTSGMLVGGPVMEHLKALAEDPKNMLLFIGYQAEGTMGRRIQRGWKELPVRADNGRTATVHINLEVQTVEGLSGHSDRNQLLSFINRLGAKPSRVIVAHGEASRAVDLARSVYKLFRIETTAPRNLESIRLK